MLEESACFWVLFIIFALAIFVRSSTTSGTAATSSTTFRLFLLVGIVAPRLSRGPTQLLPPRGNPNVRPLAHKTKQKQGMN